MVKQDVSFLCPILTKLKCVNSRKTRWNITYLNDKLYKKKLENYSVVTFYYQIECIYANEYQLYAKDLILNAFINTLNISKIVKIYLIGEIFRSVGVGLNIFGFDWNLIWTLCST